MYFFCDKFEWQSTRILLKYSIEWCRKNEKKSMFIDACVQQFSNFVIDDDDNILLRQNVLARLKIAYI